MSYIVFARKFRPQTFASVLGQGHITQALQNSVLRNKIPHALLFAGPRGVGKTTTARLIAATLNCEKLTPEFIAKAKREDIEPCGKCASCQGIAATSNIAVIEFDGASNRSVDSARELIESLQTLPPHGARYKIYIIDEAHMLTRDAWNALLKSLEEPPPNTVFIFATTETHKIIDTVISRCQRYDFARIDVQLIIGNLRKIADSEKINVSNDVLELIAKKSVGGMRDAQSMFDRLLAFSDEEINLELAKKVFGFVDNTFLQALAEAILKKDTQQCFSLINDVFSQALDLRAFCADLVQFWRNLYFVSDLENTNKQVYAVLGLTQSEFDSIAKIAKQSTKLDLLNYFERFTALADKAVASNYPRYIIEAGIIKILNSGSVKDISELINALESLKKKDNLKSLESVVAPFSLTNTKSPPPLNHSQHDSPSAEVSTNSSNIQANDTEEELLNMFYNEEIDSSSSNKSNELQNESQNIGIDSQKEKDDEKIISFPQSEYSEQPQQDFKPDWENFLTSLQNPMLKSIIKATLPKTFEKGILRIAGKKSHISSLKIAFKDQIIDSLVKYSKIKNWLIEFEILGSETYDVAGSNIAGSVAGQEAEKEKENKERLRNAIKIDPLFQEFKNIFPNHKFLSAKGYK